MATSPLRVRAILEYLVERYDARLAPARHSGARRWRYWLHSPRLGHATLLIKLICDKVVQSPMPFFVKR